MEKRLREETGDGEETGDRRDVHRFSLFRAGKKRGTSRLSPVSSQFPVPSFLPKPKGYGVFLACKFNNAVNHLGDADFVKTAVVLTGRVKLAAAGFVALTLFDFGTANIDRIKCTKEANGDGSSALDGLAPQGD